MLLWLLLATAELYMHLDWFLFICQKTDAKITSLEKLQWTTQLHLGCYFFVLTSFFCRLWFFYWTDTETWNLIINPLTLRSDQDRISPYNINSMSRWQVMRIKRNISWAIISWSNTKISKLTSWELYSRHWGQLLMWSGSEMVKLFLILIHNQK